MTRTMTNIGAESSTSALSEDARKYEQPESIASALCAALNKERETSTSSNSYSAAPSLHSSVAFPVESHDTNRSLHSASAKLSPSRRRRKLFRRIRGCVKRCLSILKASKQPESGERATEDLPDTNIRAQINAFFTQSILLELDRGIHCGGSQRYPMLRGVAMLDIQSEHSLISRSFADLLFHAAGSTELESATPFPAIETLAGPANALMERNARWYCETNPNIAVPWPRMQPTMVQSKFYIMERQCGFDVIIGLRDIVAFDLMGLRNLPLAAAHFRSPPYASGPSSFEADREAAQQSEAVMIEDDRVWKEQCDQYASGHAHQAAQVYAAETLQHLHQNHPGNDAWYQIFHQAYPGYYDHFAREYQQHNPRPNQTS